MGSYAVDGEARLGLADGGRERDEKGIKRKGVTEMPFGAGRHGRGGPRRGWGRGNPYSFCRFYPWLPRWWWSHGAGGYVGAVSPYGFYGARAPHPLYGGAQGPSYYGQGGGAAPFPGAMPYPSPTQMGREQELGFLKEQATAVKGHLDEIEARLQELGAEKE